MAKRADVTVFAPVVRRAPEETAGATPFKLVSRKRSALLWFRAWWQELSRCSPDIVHVYYSPRTFPLYAALRRAAPNARWCIDIRAPLLAQGKKLWFAQQMGLRLHHHFDLCFGTSLENARRAFPNVFSAEQGPSSAQGFPYRDLPFGVDCALASAAARGKKLLPSEGSGPRKAVYVGTLAKARRLDVLLRGVDRFCQTPQGRGFYLDLWGEGDAEEELRSYASQRGLPVRFCGRAPHDVLLQRLGHYDVGIGFVPGGAYEDSPSLKVLEYCASGLLCLASKTRAHERFMAQGFEGLVFENTEQGVCDALVRAFQNDIGAPFVQNIKHAQQYDWDVLIEERLLPSYKDLL
ncbi:glycosyltransferase [Desulfobaculum bizertense]|nr:glycosyltransferase [Desulfobaculum bizertense]